MWRGSLRRPRSQILPYCRTVQPFLTQTASGAGMSPRTFAHLPACGKWRIQPVTVEATCAPLSITIVVFAFNTLVTRDVDNCCEVPCSVTVIGTLNAVPSSACNIRFTATGELETFVRYIRVVQGPPSAMWPKVPVRDRVPMERIVRLNV